MATPRFDLVDVVQTIRKQRRFIIIVTLIAAVISAIFFFSKKKKYEAQAEFIMSNPLYGDRNNIYGDVRLIDYFGDEDDVDRILAMGESDTVQNEIIRNTHLAEIYHLDMSNRWEADKMKSIFKRNFNIKRTEYKDLKVYYTDTNAYTAANVANESIRVIEQAFHGYYNNMRHNVYLAVMEKVQQEDSSIDALTDTLAALRNLYGIYDIISPARNNIMLSSMKGNGKGNYGAAIEQIQNIESLKDQLVVDRAKHTTISNQFSTGITASDMPLAQVITEAVPPVSPKGLSGYLMIIAGAILGFVFSSLLVLIITYYRAIISVQR